MDDEVSSVGLVQMYRVFAMQKVLFYQVALYITEGYGLSKVILLDKTGHGNDGPWPVAWATACHYLVPMQPRVNP